MFSCIECIHRTRSKRFESDQLFLQIFLWKLKRDRGTAYQWVLQQLIHENQFYSLVPPSPLLDLEISRIQQSSTCGIAVPLYLAILSWFHQSWYCGTKNKYRWGHLRCYFWQHCQCWIHHHHFQTFASGFCCHLRFREGIVIIGSIKHAIISIILVITANITYLFFILFIILIITINGHTRSIFCILWYILHAWFQ